MSQLILKIRLLNKAYQAIGKHPLYHINSDFEAIDGMLDGVHEEALGLIAHGVKVEKSFVSGDK